MTLTPAQKQIASDRHRFKVVCIGRRGGKTTLAIEEIKGKIVANKRKVAYIAPTYQQARDIAWEILKKQLEKATININESRLEIRVATPDGGECLVVLRGWEAIETLRGQSFDFIVIDEIAMMRNFDIYWQEVIRPTLTDTVGKTLFISTPKGFNHFYDLYNEEAKDEDYKSFHFTSYDNPFIPKEEIDKARKELTEDRFAQEYMADFRKTEGLVYKEFNRAKHLFDDETENYKNILTYEKIAGLDFGYTNPTALISITKDTQNRYWVVNEWYKTGKTESEVADYTATQGFQRVFPDPETPSAIEELKRRGVNVRDVIKNKDSIKSGIQYVRELLLANRLFIHKKCLNLISEFETYSYGDKKDLHNEEENPIKEHDHALDALRYALSSDKTGQRTQANVFVPKPYINATVKISQESGIINNIASVHRPNFIK